MLDSQHFGEKTLFEVTREKKQTLQNDFSSVYHLNIYFFQQLFNFSETTRNQFSRQTKNQLQNTLPILATYEHVFVTGFLYSFLVCSLGSQRCICAFWTSQFQFLGIILLQRWFCGHTSTLMLAPSHLNPRHMCVT